MVDYSKYSTAELANRVDYRRLTIPDKADVSRNARARRTYIELLEQADRATCFRFLDLPAEMKNLVYEELLTLREGMNTCYPQILRTRKEIHEEARDLIRVEKTVNIEVARDGVRADGLRCGEYFSTINTGRHSRRRINLSIEDLHWPTLVRKTNKLHITVSEPWRIGATIYQGARLPLRNMLAREGLKVVDNVLYSLASFLCRYGLVSVITIDLSSMPPGLQPWETVLYPIRFLHQVQHIDILGAPESTTKQAVASARTIGPRNLVWGRFAELYERARICRVLAEHNPILMDAVRPTARTPPRSSQSVFGSGGLIVGCDRSARRVRNLFRGSLQFFDKKWESGAGKQMRNFLNDLELLKNAGVHLEMQMAKDTLRRMIDELDEAIEIL